jgi:hypothetical protein
MTLYQEIAQFAEASKSEFSDHFKRILKSEYLSNSKLFTKIYYKLKSFLQQLYNKLKENAD